MLAPLSTQSTRRWDRWVSRVCGSPPAPLNDTHCAVPRSASSGTRITRITRITEHEHEHEHEHDRDRDHGRAYADVRTLIQAAGFQTTPRARDRALAAFRLLAEAEGRIHGLPVDSVHFHEVGSQDSIADVVGVCVALELLGVDAVECSPLPLGRGQIVSAHGVLPLPAPATLELLRGIPVVGVDIAKEMVTPTGAALVASLATRFGGLPAMTVDAIGYGAGGRDLAERPNIVRVLIGSPTAALTVGTADTQGRQSAPEVVLIETNLDDCSPELIPDASAAVLVAGALDVWTSQVLMKKGRPGFVLHALARRPQSSAVAQAMLRETSALGVRMCTYERVELARRFVQVSVQGHIVSIKVGAQGNSVVNLAPEHDDCARAASALGLAVKEVYGRALAAGQAVLDAELATASTGPHE